MTDNFEDNNARSR